MAFIVTGTPGTGKTTFARKLAQEKRYEYLDLNEFARAVGAVEGIDAERDAQIVDEKKVVKALTAALKKNPKVVIDGHFSHELSPKVVERCFVTKCELKELKKRLTARKYSGAKIEENLQAEIFDMCFVEAVEKGHAVEVVKTDKTI